MMRYDVTFPKTFFYNKKCQWLFNYFSFGQIDNVGDNDIDDQEDASDVFDALDDLPTLREQIALWLGYVFFY